MSKAAVFTMKLEPDLRAEFLAAAEANLRSVSQVIRELMREFVQRQQERREHGDFLHRKVDAARALVHDGRGRSNETVEADFVARGARITDRT